MEILLIRGQFDAGKTTTSALLYENLLNFSEKEHYFSKNPEEFKGNKVYENSLIKNEKGDFIDFISILIVKCKIVVIISAGDEVWRMIYLVDVLLEFVNNILNSEIDYLICCGRSHNRKGCALFELQNKFENVPIHEFWVSNNKNIDIKTSKIETIENIIRIILL